MKRHYLTRILEQSSCHHLWLSVVLASLLLIAGSDLTASARLSKHLGTRATTPMPFAAPVDVKVLTPGSIVRMHINANTTHVYQLTLASQQFASVVVNQKGADIDLRVTTPNESPYISVDSPNGFYGTETASIIAESAGTYRIDVHYDSGFPSGDYELSVEGPRPVSRSDEMRVSAERLFAQAQQLRADGPINYEEAITRYNEAANLWGELGDIRRQGYALMSVGRIHKARNQLNSALDYLDKSLALLQQAGDMSGQAFALNETGAAYRDFGDLRKALVHYDTALKLRIELGDRFGQAQLYNNIGLTYSYIGYQLQSIENHEKALAIWHALNLRQSEMNSRINAAKAHIETGNLDMARSQYQIVLDYCNTELGNVQSQQLDTARRLKPSALNGLGLVSDTWADNDSALNYYQEALELFHENKNVVGEADVLDNLGMTHAFLGDKSRAIQYFLQALELRKVARQPRSWGMTLSNLGYAYTLNGDYAEAQTQLQLALTLTIDTHDRRFEAYTLWRLGMTYFEMPEPQPLKALEYYEKALAIQQEPGFEDRRGQALTLDKIAEALALSGQEVAALKKYEDAIELWKFVGDKQGQALSLYGIARIERDRLNLANARDRIEEAIGIVEKLRSTVTGRQLQMTYFAGKQVLYALAIDVRMQLYDAKKSTADLEAALALSEKARARNLLDLLANAGADFYKGIPIEVADRTRRLDREISELTQYLVRSRGVAAKKDIASVQEILDARTHEYDRLIAPFKRAVARSRQAQPLAAQQIQQLLDDDMLLLQYSLDEKRSYLWAVTRTSIDPYYLPGRARIEKAANELRQALTDKEAQREGETEIEVSRRRQSATIRYRQSAAELSHLILTDVGPKLGNKRLIIVADGRLHYIPFEALPLPGSTFGAEATTVPSSARPLLLINNEVIYQPSASALAMLRSKKRPIASRKVAVVADPVFNNVDTAGARGKDGAKPELIAKQKLSRSLRDIGDSGNGAFILEPLEFARKEANAIAAVAPRGSRQYVGFKANRALATSPLLRQFGYVHFTTHGILNEKNPELSGIVLSMVNQRGKPENGYLTLRDIYKLDLPTHLVVVSACETGISTPIRGEGLIGLTRGFMNAGAQSVVVSLWRVEDEATAELMKRFYAHMFGKTPMSPSSALRQAKIEMKDQYHPYQWAGFVLQGDWK